MYRHIYRILIIILALLLLPSAVFADGGSPLDQAVPFGITVSKSGQYVPVFDGIGSKNRIDLLLPGELCALDYAELESADYWYHIVYLDENGEAHAGYVKESNFEQMTLSRLTEAMSDPAAAELINRYLDLEETSSLFLGKSIAESTRMQVQEPSGQHYVLNTNTMKFHYPGCKSVKQMKEKNRKDFVGDRKELIKQGYVPCKNCNP